MLIIQSECSNKTKRKNGGMYRQVWKKKTLPGKVSARGEGVPVYVTV
jgi:hypothetical protein